MGADRLELYILPATDSGRAALESVERFRAGLQRPLELVVYDLHRSPLAAQHARVLVTPTLILRRGDEERRCLGDFSDGGEVAHALGLEAAAG